MGRVAAMLAIASQVALSFGLIRLVDDEAGVENDFAIAAIVLGAWIVVGVAVLLWLASDPFDQTLR
jgi:hypothetical protein